MAKTLEGIATEFVSEVNGRVEVDWQGLAKFKRKLMLEGDGSRSWLPLFNDLLDYLFENGILTYSIKNSWTITGGGFDLSPSKGSPSFPLYFTRKKDAEAYIGAFYQHLYTRAIIKPARETV